MALSLEGHAWQSATLERKEVRNLSTGEGQEPSIHAGSSRFPIHNIERRRSPSKRMEVAALFEGNDKFLTNYRARKFRKTLINSTKSGRFGLDWASSHTH
jgi:hypothetical protein